MNRQLSIFQSFLLRLRCSSWFVIRVFPGIAPLGEEIHSDTHPKQAVKVWKTQFAQLSIHEECYETHLTR